MASHSPNRPRAPVTEVAGNRQYQGRSRSLEAVRGELVGALRVGVSLADACRHASVSDRTVRHWIARGRREPGTAYATLAREVDAARETAGDVGPMDEAELLRVVSRAVRGGSVPAMKLMWEIHRAPVRPAPTGAPLLRPCSQ